MMHEYTDRSTYIYVRVFFFSILWLIDVYMFWLGLA
jgi:hypothetical protein